MRKRIVTGLSFVLTLVTALTIAQWVGPIAHAYNQWSTNQADLCASCHGDFLATGYTSNVDGSAWNTSLHDGHRGTNTTTSPGMLSRDCNTCHVTSRFPVSLSSSGGGTGFAAISCLGCHGRLENGPGGPGIVTGTGLRQHHIQTGAASCATSTCHSSENPLTFTPVPEKVLPPYYFRPDTAHPSKPIAPCNPSGNTESKIGSGRGMDNDGNGLFDLDDPSCQAKVDFDKDGKTDVAFYRPSTGAWWIAPSSGAAAYGVGWGDSTDKPVIGDYDGDGIADITVYHASTGAWWIKPSSGAPAYGVGWGGPSFTPIPGDYDGDGKTDITIYSSSTGAWWIKPSSGKAVYGVGWGGTGFVPVPGDYDGDGKTDIAIFNPTTGAWYISPSSGAAAYGVGWGGIASDEPVPEDYDGDGKTDIAFYRTTTGAWWIIRSSTGVAYGVGWGGDTSDKPVPGDYDKDGKTDIAVYRVSTGAWWISPSSGAAAYGVGWGGAGMSDIPVTANINSIY